MSLELVKRDANAFQRFSHHIVYFGDGLGTFLIGIVSGIVVFITSLILTFEGSNEYLYLLGLLWPLFVVLVLVSAEKGTLYIKSSDYERYGKASKEHMPKIVGHDHEAIARPLLDKMYICTIEGHPGAESGYYCSRCGERERLIKELIPVKPSDESDIESAKRFLAMKREADELHRQALKELSA